MHTSKLSCQNECRLRSIDQGWSQEKYLSCIAACPPETSTSTSAMAQASATLLARQYIETIRRSLRNMSMAGVSMFASSENIYRANTAQPCHVEHDKPLYVEHDKPLLITVIGLTLLAAVSLGDNLIGIVGDEAVAMPLALAAWEVYLSR